LKTNPRPPSRRGEKRAAPNGRKVNVNLPGKTIQELARERGAKPFDPAAYAGIVPLGEDIGAFVEEIYRART
jgi:hypothetical protein